MLEIWIWGVPSYKGAGKFCFVLCWSWRWQSVEQTRWSKVTVSAGQQQQPDSSVSSSGNESKDDGRGDNTNAQRDTEKFVYKQWRRFGFFDQLCVVFQLSAFHPLTCIYKVLATLPVTSCSAERAMSRLKIIKNRLSSTTIDERLVSLMIIASETDVLDTISTVVIIYKFAMSSDVLKKLLLPV